MSGHEQSRSGVQCEHSKKIDALFSAYDRTGSPGLNLAVISHGKIIHQRGYGVADLEHDTPFNSATQLRLGSTTKHMCASCIFLLENRNLLSLEDDIHKFVPELPDFSSRITIRHLLTMTSGFRDGLNMLLFSGQDSNDEITRNTIMQILFRDTRLMFKPGDNCTYSNTNYALLSTIIERITKCSLADFMQRNLFMPLGMKHSELIPMQSTHLTLLASGYLPEEDGKSSKAHTLLELSGDGGVVSNLDDMVRWFKNYRNDQLFGPDYRARIEAANPLNNGQTCEYRHGMYVASFLGETKISHAGGLPGYLSDFAYFPESDLGIILLTNVFDVSLLEATDKIALTIIAGSRDIARRRTQTNNYSLSPLGIFASQEAALVLHFVQEKRHLVCYLLGERHQLTQKTEHTYISSKPDYAIEITFDTTTPDQITLALGNMRATVLYRIDEPGNMPASCSDEYSGKYFSPATQATHEINVCEAMLTVTLTSSDKELVWKNFNHVIGDLFTSEIEGEPSNTNVQIKFTRDKEYSITGLSYSLSRCLAVEFIKMIE